MLEAVVSFASDASLLKASALGCTPVRPVGGSRQDLVSRTGLIGTKPSIGSDQSHCEYSACRPDSLQVRWRRGRHRHRLCGGALRPWSAPDVRRIPRPGASRSRCLSAARCCGWAETTQIGEQPRALQP